MKSKRISLILNKSKENNEKFILILLGAMIAVYLFAIFLPQRYKSGPLTADDYKSSSYASGWKLDTGDGSYQDVRIPSRVHTSDGTTRIINTLPDDLAPGTWMSVFNCVQEMKIYVDGQLRTSFQLNPGFRDGIGHHTGPACYVFAPLYAADAGKEVVVETMSDSIYAGTLGEVMLGTQAGIWAYYARRYTRASLVTVVLLILSLIVCGSSLVFTFINRKSPHVLFISLGIIAACLWRLGGTPRTNTFLQMEFRHPDYLYEIACQALAFISLPYLLFADSVQKGRYRRIYRPLFYFSFFFGLVLSMLHYFGIAYFPGTFEYTTIPIICSMGAIFVLTIIDLIKGYMRQYLIIGTGLIVVMITVAMEVARQLLHMNLFITDVYGFGLLFLLISVVVSAVHDILEVQIQTTIAKQTSEKKSNFLTLMSHRVRTPVNTIVGMSELITDETNDPIIAGYANGIQNAVKMLMSLISDMLEAGNAATGDIILDEKEYRLSDVLNDSINLLRTTAGQKGLSLRTDISKSLPSGLYGDDIRLRQIITNILTNAVKYTEKGCVTFIADSSGDNANFVLHISIIDTGIGIKEEDMDAIFDSYQRLDEKENRHIQGTGLGLSITRRLIELMNGRIEVRSDYGKGSTFDVYLPQMITDKAPIGGIAVAEPFRASQSKSANQLRAPGACVLVVDDNMMNLEVFSGLLKKTAIAVDTAPGGYEALELSELKKYDLIFMDHMMPKPDGIETLHLIRENTSLPNASTPIVVLTANAVAGARERYLNEGFSAYLSKPVTYEELEQVLREFLPIEKIEQ